jgi:hypothetical protein
MTTPAGETIGIVSRPPTVGNRAPAGETLGIVSRPPTVENITPTVENTGEIQTMKRKFTSDDQRDFIGAMQFLELMWGVKTHYSIDADTGRGVVQVWLPGTETVLHLEAIDVRHLRVIERNQAKFPDPRS